MYVVSNVISHTQFPGVTFRNVICHSNFHKYDTKHYMAQDKMCMCIPRVYEKSHNKHTTLFRTYYGLTRGLIHRQDSLKDSHIDRDFTKGCHKG